MGEILDYLEFKDAIYRITRVNLSDYKENQMKRRIDTLINKKGYSGYSDYLKLILKDRDELDEFLSYITINVSEFFRNPNHWEILENDILPTIINNRETLKIWSAACSTGDEPYSLVMMLSKYLPFERIKVIATDIDKEILEKAQLGEYNDSHLKRIPQDLKDKYIIDCGNGIYKVDDRIKRCVQFKQHNLLEDAYYKDSDLIVCRNVMIYFTEECKDIMYKKFCDALSQKGVLFIGSTEQIINPARYGLKSNKIFFYNKS